MNVRTVATVLLAGLVSVSAFADEVKTADDCVARHIEALGGTKKINSIKSMRVQGKQVSSMQGFEVPFQIEIVRPDKMRLEATLQGMTMVQVLADGSGWMTVPFMGKPDPEPMSQDMVDTMSDELEIFGPLIDYKDKGHKLEFLGADDLEGTDVYKLKVTKKNGTVETHYLDAEAFLTLQIKGKRVIMGSPMEYEVAMTNFKEVNGLMLPHTQHQKGGPMGGGSVMLEKIEFNVDVPASRFVMPEPAAVKAVEQKPAEKPAGADKAQSPG